ncbi:MAG TPA: hypothetical protein VEQ10_07015, partial [Vicinamibacteria bacterium]|nr:hypothetical protein [Vicinamibacteria bacterium]
QGLLGLGAERQEPVGDRLRLQVRDDCLGPTVAAIEAAGGRVLSVLPVRESLEDYFLREVGGGAQRDTWGEG